jgi:hypothetical protein
LQIKTEEKPMKDRSWIVIIGFLAAAIFFLWEEHRAHILGVLPWAILLLCPILHLFMHRGHGGHDSHGGGGGGTHGNRDIDKGDGGGK